MSNGVAEEKSKWCWNRPLLFLIGGKNFSSLLSSSSSSSSSSAAELEADRSSSISSSSSSESLSYHPSLRSSSTLNINSSLYAFTIASFFSLASSSSLSFSPVVDGASTTAAASSRITITARIKSWWLALSLCNPIFVTTCASLNPSAPKMFPDVNTPLCKLAHVLVPCRHKRWLCSSFVKSSQLSGGNARNFFSFRNRSKSTLWNPNRFGIFPTVPTSCVRFDWIETLWDAACGEEKKSTLSNALHSSSKGLSASWE